MKTRNIVLLLTVLVLMTLTIGCATYGAKDRMPSFRDPASLSAGTKVPTKMGEGVIASAYPLTTVEENKKYFDENLLESGVVAIFLEVQNDPMVKGNGKMRLIAATFEIEEQKDDKGNVVMKKSSFRAMAAQGVYTVVKRNWGGRATTLGVLTIVGFPISAAATDHTNNNIQEDLEGGKILSIPSGEIGTIDALKGFVCFKISDQSLEVFPKGVLKLLFSKEGKLVEYNLPIL